MLLGAACEDLLVWRERSDAEVLLEMVEHCVHVTATARKRMGITRNPMIRAKWNEIAGEYERRTQALRAAVQALTA